MPFLSAALLLTGLAALVRSQGADFAVPSDFTAWDNENWVLSTNELIQGQYQSRLSLANGYLGCAQAAAGPFFEADQNLTNPDGSLPINGWPLDNPRQTFCTIAGFWNSQANTTRTNFPWLLQYGGESVISGVPHWAGILFDFGGTQLDAQVDNTTISNFTSSLSAKRGVATWSYTWSPSTAPNTDFTVTYTLLVSRSRPNAAAVRADVVASADYQGTVTDLLDGRSAVRSTAVGKGLDEGTQSIYSAVHPNGLANITAYIVSSMSASGSAVDLSTRRMADAPWVSTNETSIGQTFDISLQAGQTVSVFKFVGGASADAFADPQQTARNASESAQASGWESLLAEHEAAWAEILPLSSVDDYSSEDRSLPEDPNIRDFQISSVLTPFYLLQNSLSGTLGQGLDDNSITVGGLTSDSYGGLVFWDADTFMSPGLVVSHPEYARTIAEFRIAKAGQARANAAANNYTAPSVLYPWTSGRFGNCTATGPCTDYQYHLNADIAGMLLQHRNVSGDEQWWVENAWPIYQGVAQMFSELVRYNESTTKYEIYNMTDPDEYANGINNGAFTLASASKVLTTANEFLQLYGQPINETWAKIVANVAIPYDSSGITTEYDGMNNSVPVKQADVVLTTYPLDYEQNYTEAQSLNDLDYYANKQSPDGPAMTYSILSIDANDISLSGCSAYTYALNAFQPYSRAPWYQFSEQLVDNFTANGGTNPAFPFLTGHGGFNQIGPFGWLGMRTDRQYLHVNPALPPQIPHVRLRALYYGGATLNAVLNQTHTTITRLQTTNTFVNDTYGALPMPIVVGETERTMRTVSIGETITIENRDYFSNLTIPNNLLQCQPAISNEPTAPGQFALAAIDGATSTKWQPETPERAGMVIDMSNVPIQRLVGITFNWGLAPPMSADVILSNSSTFDGEGVIIPIRDIGISTPFMADSVTIAPYTGNTTNVSIANAGPVYTGKYAKLEIEGTQGSPNTTGATVAEFALIGMGGQKMVKRWWQEAIPVLRRN
ncbi:MAG: hypothetical protein M1817_002500 [Caeruleum heppii]|nr:MAG: hypothetical protein M1817_002500 [Caeruleum heppii]